MDQEYRSSMYWGSGEMGKWFMESISSQTKEDRFRGSSMNFIRYAVKYCLTHDKSLKAKPDLYPGDNS